MATTMKTLYEITDKDLANSPHLISLKQIAQTVVQHYVRQGFEPSSVDGITVISCTNVAGMWQVRLLLEHTRLFSTFLDYFYFPKDSSVLMLIVRGVNKPVCSAEEFVSQFFTKS